MKKTTVRVTYFIGDTVNDDWLEFSSKQISVQTWGDGRALIKGPTGEKHTGMRSSYHYQNACRVEIIKIDD